jgi:hypothetical protein
MTEREPIIRAGFTLALLGVVVVMAAMTWPVMSASYRIPAFILVPTAVLLVYQLINDMRPAGSQRSTGSTDGLACAFAWLLLMPVLLAALGLVFGGGLYTLAYLRLGNNDRWMLALVCALAVGGALALLAYTLRMPQLFSGLLW